MNRNIPAEYRFIQAMYMAIDTYYKENGETDHPRMTNSFVVHPQCLQEAYTWYLKNYRLTGSFDTLISLIKSFKKLHKLPRQNKFRYGDSAARPILFPSPVKIKAHMQNIGFWSSCLDGMEMVPNADLYTFNCSLKPEQIIKQKRDLIECGGMREVTTQGALLGPPCKKARRNDPEDHV
jgi:hypothetical protein